MKKLISYIQRSLSTRLSLLIVVFSAAILVASLGFMFRVSSKVVHQEAISRATQSLESTALRVQGILDRVKVATDNTDWLITRHLDGPDSMFVYSRRILENNPDLNGCSIAFEPDFFKEKGRWFSAYSLNDHGTIKTSQEGNPYYEYFYMDWYQLCKLLDRPVWTEPFADYNPECFYSSEMITSYCKPIKDREGSYIGTISVDLSLNWLSQTISAVKPYPNSYSIMIGRGGTYFVHPDTNKLFYQTIFTETLDHEDTALASLGHAMLNGEEGIRQLKIDGEDCYVFYKPLGETGWSTAIVCPESDIFGSFNRMKMAIILAVCAGLLLLLYMSIRIITRELKPLKQLAKEAEAIASGNFDEPLPESNRTDEIGQLSHSFAGMQQSLVKYIEELKDTTSQKASIERDLQVASSIQMGMLPEKFPTKADRDDVQLFASLTPAKEVGGDLFDFYFRDEKLFFCIGDVSGKGVPASLFMAVTRSTFRTVSAHESSPDRIVTLMNQTIADMNKNHMFVTLFVGVLDLPTGRLYYCNAGHDAPLLVGDGVGELPCDPNIPVGFRPSWKYTLQEAQIFTDTTIFLFTDGLTEAEDATHAQFQMDRVNEEAAKALSCGQNEPRQIIESMTAAVHQFVGGAEQSDDLTMMAIQYIKPQNIGRIRKSIVLPNDVKVVPRLTDFVTEACEVVGFDEMITMQMNVAIEEAVVNVMKYAYPEGVRGDVTIEAATNGMRLKFTIIDSGKPFDPTVHAAVDTTLPASQRAIGGLGIHLVRQIMDSISYERVDDHNVLTLRKKLGE